MTGLRNHYKATKLVNIEATKADTLAFGVLVRFPDSEPQEFDSAYFTVRDWNENIMFQKSLSDGIQYVESDEDWIVYRVRALPSDMDIDLGDYKYDLQIGMNDDILTLVKGTLRVTYEVTY